MAVEGLGLVLHEQRRPGGGVAAEPEEVLEAQPPALRGRQPVRRLDALDLVAQRPHRVEPQRLVTGGVGQHVGVLALRVADVVVHRVEQQPGHDASRRDGAAGVARGGDVVVEQGAERAIDQVELFEQRQLSRRERRPGVGGLFGEIEILATPGSELERHRMSPRRARRYRARAHLGATLATAVTPHPPRRHRPAAE
jgi:hypothetical protein